MRTALIAALALTGEGRLRAELTLAGRSVLAWQVALARGLGAERIICLCEGARGEVLRLQHAVEAEGAAFHAMRGFAALPALVRAEDDLIILRDGLLPDPALVEAMVSAAGRAPHRIACLPEDSPLVASHPAAFERIDAARHWAGLLIMRGAAVQKLADFPADADPVSVLLRLALQAGTPCHDLGAAQVPPEAWLLADDAAAIAAHEQRLIVRAAPEGDWRAPGIALAGVLVRQLAMRGMGHGSPVAAGLAAALLIAGGVIAALGAASAALAVAAAGAFAGAAAMANTQLVAALRREPDGTWPTVFVRWAGDGLAAAVLLLALAPPGVWSAPWAPLAICGPLAIGLAGLAASSGTGAIGSPFWSDRAAQLALLAGASALGLLPAATAVLAAAALAALLLRGSED